jgi:hypothetical protein
MQGLPKIIADIAMIAERSIPITTGAVTEMHVLSLVIMEEILDLMNIFTREVHINLTTQTSRKAISQRGTAPEIAP